MRENLQNLEIRMKKEMKSKEFSMEKLEVMQRDIDHLMGSGRSNKSNLSGVSSVVGVNLKKTVIRSTRLCCL